MVKLDSKNKCPECGSIQSQIIRRFIDDQKREEIRICKEGCKRDKETLRKLEKGPYTIIRE